MVGLKEKSIYSKENAVYWKLFYLGLIILATISFVYTLYKINSYTLDMVFTHLIISFSAIVLSMLELTKLNLVSDGFFPVTTDLGRVGSVIVNIGGMMILILTNLMLLWVRTSTVDILLTDAVVFSLISSYSEYVKKYMNAVD